jgi:hypothetical protein
MRRKEVIAQSPLRILDTSIRGGLGRGNLGLIMAQAGLGKTACLVQIGLDLLLREKTVLHVAFERSVPQITWWYDFLFDDLARATELTDAAMVKEQLGRRRLIATFADHDLSVDRLHRTIDTFRRHLDFAPHAILIDGHDRGPPPRQAVEALKGCAAESGAELWMTAQTHGLPTRRVPEPWARLGDLVDVVVYLEPEGELVAVRVLKDHGNATPPDVRLRLHPDTGRLVTEESTESVEWLPPSAYTLLSGAAGGAEACFGACAEEWGLEEMNFSFAGREPKRSRGLIELSDEELERGAVGAAFQGVHLHRAMPQTEAFQKVLKSIWHQVNTAGEVFSVGSILDDGSVKGGTGWAVELARTWRKPLFVFDQEKRGWFVWGDGGWTACDDAAVVIRARRFAGTGTRYLSPVGRDAIRALFTRSFGPAV